MATQRFESWWCTKCEGLARMHDEYEHYQCNCRVDDWPFYRHWSDWMGEDRRPETWIRVQVEQVITPLETGD